MGNPSTRMLEETGRKVSSKGPQSPISTVERIIRWSLRWCQADSPNRYAAPRVSVNGAEGGAKTPRLRPNKTGVRTGQQGSCRRQPLRERCDPSGKLFRHRIAMKTPPESCFESLDALRVMHRSRILGVKMRIFGWGWICTSVTAY